MWTTATVKGSPNTKHQMWAKKFFLVLKIHAKIKIRTKRVTALPFLFFVWASSFFWTCSGKKTWCLVVTWCNRPRRLFSHFQSEEAINGVLLAIPLQSIPMPTALSQQKSCVSLLRLLQFSTIQTIFSEEHQCFWKVDGMFSTVLILSTVHFYENQGSQYGGAQLLDLNVTSLPISSKSCQRELFSSTWNTLLPWMYPYSPIFPDYTSQH